jgi:hypothetical protein
VQEADDFAGVDPSGEILKQEEEVRKRLELNS